MKFDEYQDETHRLFLIDVETYKVENDNKNLVLSRLALGLTEEAGEIAGKVKKYLRGDFDFEELKKQVSKEAGDQLWYLNEVLSILDLKLSNIAQENLDKLAGRRKRGTILGTGDNR